MTTNIEERRTRRRRSFPEATPIPLNMETPMFTRRIRSQQRDALDSTTSEESDHTYEEPYSYSTSEQSKGTISKRDLNKMLTSLNTVGKADLPTFSGAENENIKAFFDNFEKLALFNGWDEERKLQAIPITFSKKANYYYVELTDDVKASYKKLKAKMIERLSSAHTRCKKKAESRTVFIKTK